MENTSTPRKSFQRVSKAAKFEFCVACGENILIKYGDLVKSRRLLWDENKLKPIGITLEHYLNVKLDQTTDSNVICVNCKRRVDNAEKRQQEIRGTFLQGRRKLLEMLEDAPTEKRMLPSDVMQDLPPPSRQRLQLGQKYEPPPETEVEVRFRFIQEATSCVQKSKVFNSIRNPGLEVF